MIKIIINKNAQVRFKNKEMVSKIGLSSNIISNYIKYILFLDIKYF